MCEATIIVHGDDELQEGLWLQSLLNRDTLIKCQWNAEGTVTYFVHKSEQKHIMFKNAASLVWQDSCQGDRCLMKSNDWGVLLKAKHKTRLHTEGQVDKLVTRTKNTGLKQCRA